jgi:hypothetical protein
MVMAMVAAPAGTEEGDSPAREEEEERFRPDQGLTWSSPVMSSWPEEGYQRRI